MKIHRRNVGLICGLAVEAAFMGAVACGSGPRNVQGFTVDGGDEAADGMPSMMDGPMADTGHEAAADGGGASGPAMCCTYATGQTAPDGGAVMATNLCTWQGVTCDQSSCTYKQPGSGGGVGVFGTLTMCPTCSGPVTTPICQQGNIAFDPQCAGGSGYPVWIGLYGSLACVCPSGTMCGYTASDMCSAECR